MEISRRTAIKLLSVGTLGSSMIGGALARAAEGRVVTVNNVANALGIHIPALAAIFEVLPSMPGYGVPKMNRMEHHLTQVQTLLAGKADFANPDPLTVFRAAEGGSDIRIIGNPDMGTSLVFVVNADVVTSFADLAKPEVVVAVDSKKDVTHVLLVGPLLKRGVDLKKVTIVEIGGSGARMRALLSKRVHAVPVHFDQAAEIVKQGNFKVLLEPAKEYRVWTHECWAASGSWLKKPENQRVAVDFMKATIMAHRRATSDFAWYAAMYRKYSTLPKAAEATDDQLRPTWQRLAHEIKAWPASNDFSRENYRELMPTFLAAEAIKGTVKLEQVIDTTYVQQALKELGADPAMAKLEVAGISKSFEGRGGSVHVLRDLSLTVGELEFLTVIGPSGCGKSTFLRIVDGLIPSDAGTVRIDGNPLTGPSPKLSMVFQSFDLFPWRTALENVQFGLEIQRLPKAARREVSRYYIEMVGLGEFAEAYPHQLSGGMQQRVGLARALAVRPEILLMDEPFGSLDVQTRDLLQDELLGIWQREQKTVLFVTHSIEEAIYLADRIVIFTPRPTGVERTIQVPFGRPRDESLKSSAAFLDLRREIWAALKKNVRI